MWNTTDRLSTSKKAKTLRFLTVAILTFLGAEKSTAQNCTPLLMPGKKTLYQRVISHPEAELFIKSDNSDQFSKRPIKPFTVYYVYKHEMANEVEWLLVGTSSACKPLGWIKRTDASDWNQILTLVFTERTGRQPVLFFKDMDSLMNPATSRSPGESIRQLVSDFTSIKSKGLPRPEGFPVIAIEPSPEAVSSRRFYLMPIIRWKQVFEDVKFLEVACIDPGSGPKPARPLSETRELKTAIAFVIDTTISMKPYIDRTREAVRKIYDSLEKSGLTDKVAFGLVAFQNSIERTPGLDYVSAVLSNLKDGHQRKEFESALAQTNEASVSSHSFNEEAFAGLKTAIDDLDWSAYYSRLIFLITDAGAIRNDDPYSTTGMNESEIADLAKANNIKIFALHLKTTSGRTFSNHTFAATQYRTLTGHSDPNIGDLYVPIEADEPGSGVKGFGQVVERIAAQMVELVKATSADKRLALPEKPSSQPINVAEEAERKASILGYAMQLEFLGQQSDIQAPSVVTSWVSDIDLSKPDTPSFQVAVLLTKNQLSDLHKRLKIILGNAQRSKRTGARDFFQSILSAAAQMSRDPDRFRMRPNQNLGQLNILAEFLDDLPYRSNIMRLTEDDWYRFSVGEQQSIIDDLKSKIRRYEQYHNDVENWVNFGDDDPGESVYRVPLSMMP